MPPHPAPHPVLQSTDGPHTAATFKQLQQRTRELQQRATAADGTLQEQRRKVAEASAGIKASSAALSACALQLVQQPCGAHCLACTRLGLAGVCARYTLCVAQAGRHGRLPFQPTAHAAPLTLHNPPTGRAAQVQRHASLQGGRGGQQRHAAAAGQAAAGAGLGRPQVPALAFLACLPCRGDALTALGVVGSQAAQVAAQWTGAVVILPASTHVLLGPLPCCYPAGTTYDGSCSSCA